MSDLSWDVLQKLHDQFAAIAIAIFNNGEEVAPQLFLLRPDSTGQGAMAALPPEMMRQFFGAEGGKDQLARLLESVLTEGHPLRQQVKEAAGFEPTVLVQVNEAWALLEPQEEDLEKLAAGGTLAKHPQRREVVLVALHTRFGSFPTYHLVEDKPHRHCVQGPMQRSDELAFKGRFSMQEAFGLSDSAHGKPAH